MTRLRPFIHAILGLVLLVQGFAVAAADRRIDLSNPDATVASEQAMPCHDGMSGAAGCCEADCPDMASCALSHIATAPAATPLVARPAARPISTPTLMSSAAAPRSLLRPPIALHG